MACDNHDTIGVRVEGLYTSAVILKDIEGIYTGETVSENLVELTTSRADVSAVAIDTELSWATLDLEATRTLKNISFGTNLAGVIFIIEKAVKVDDLAYPVNGLLSDRTIDVIDYSLNNTEIVLELKSNLADLTCGVDADKVGTVFHKVFTDVS